MPRRCRGEDTPTYKNMSPNGTQNKLVTVKELAELLHVNIKTIKRDIEKLKAENKVNGKLQVK